MKKQNSTSSTQNRYDWRKLGFELVVVFLGVTAGFLLNNWRIERQEKKLEQKYITGFLQDLQSNITELELALKEDSIWLENASPLLQTITERNIPHDSAKTMMKNIVKFSKLNASKGTYLDIINSGNLNILSDFKMRSELINYHQKLNGVELFDDFFYQYFNDFVMPFLFKEFDILEVEFNNPEIIHSKQFANLFAGYFSMIQQRKATYSDLLKKSYTLKKILENNKL